MVPDKYNLIGKTALITGAAGLLGREHAAALLESGATVVLTDISKTALNAACLELSKNFGQDKVLTVLMDVSKLTEIRSCAKSLCSAGVRIDVLVNNAAVDPKVMSGDSSIENSRLETFSLKQWDQELAVGLTGAFLCSQVFGTLMAKDELGGVILNVASDLSVFSPDQRLYRNEDLPDDLQSVKPVTYSVIKTGLIGLTRYLATYWADKGVRCNALSPGGVFNGQSDDFTHRLSSLVPLGRMADRDEYRSAMQFLCSDASAYMNGQNLVIDGGRSIW
jgi:NAD(P)-dependent dehydrogenase (short-subunit alcohol dehydrogenase family)